MRLQDAPEGIRDPLQVETELICQSLVPAELQSAHGSGIIKIQSWKGPRGSCRNNCIVKKQL